MKVCHLTSVHSWNDTRIFHKQCCSLQQAGYDVHVIAPDGDERTEKGVKLHRLANKRKNRWWRIVSSPFLMYAHAKRMNAQLYHFHDPELLITGLLLRWSGKLVVYDVHEDVPRQILYKTWLPKRWRKLISFCFEKVEMAIAKRLSAIVTVTETIAQRFEQLGCRTVVVKNYPILAELLLPDDRWEKKERAVCYVGSITKERGLYEMIAALEQTTDVRLLLGGTFAYAHDRNDVQQMAGWRNVEELGHLTRDDVKRTLARARCGIVLLHPTATYIDSLPVKMFEYMAAGIPVVASRFPLWKQIVEEAQCGVCVDPFDVASAANAIQQFVDEPALAKKMGENGKRAVQEKYSWEEEAKKLIHLYDELLRRKGQK